MRKSISQIPIFWISTKNGTYMNNPPHDYTKLNGSHLKNEARNRNFKNKPNHHLFYVVTLTHDLEKI